MHPTYALNNILCAEYERQPASRACNKQQRRRQLQLYGNECMYAFLIENESQSQTGFGCKGKSDSLLFMVFSRQVSSFARRFRAPSSACVISIPLAKILIIVNRCSFLLIYQN